MCRFIVLSLLALQSFLLAQPEAITGRVVDGDGRPIASAEVWLTGPAPGDERARIVAEATTDAEGAFSLLPTDPAAFRDPSWLNVLALAEGYAFGSRNCAEAMETGLPVVVVCGPLTRTSGRIVDTDGRGVAARIVPRRLQRSGPWEAARSLVWLPPELGERLAVSTTATGHFTITSRPDDCSMSLTARSETYGDVALGGQADCGELVLPPPAKLVVRLLCPEHPAAAAGVRIVAAGGDPRGRGMADAGAVTDADGVATLPPLQPGPVHITPQFYCEAPWQTVPVRLDLQAGQNPELQIPLQRAHLVSGRVTDDVTGRPVPEVQLTPTSGVVYLQTALPVTDREGRFRVGALPGSLHLDTERQAGRLIPLDENGFARLTVSDRDVVLPDLVMRHGPKVAGTVVDEEGRPVPSAEVWLAGRQHEGPMICDEAGRFVTSESALPGTGDEDARRHVVRLWAQSGEMMTRELIAAHPGETITVTLHRSAACRVRLRVIDADGAPVRGAQVAVSIHINEVGAPFPPLHGRTDENGDYRSRPTWPYGEFSAEVGKAGFCGARTDRGKAEPGATCDLGDVTIVPGRGEVSGRVVDAGGRPVYWARVVTAGEGPGDVVERTDVEGRFRVRGLYEGRVWIVATSGGAVGAVRLPTGTAEAEIKLEPLLREAALQAPVAFQSATDMATDKQVAKALLDEIRGRLGSNSMYRVGPLLEAWVLLDPGGALAISELEGGYVNSVHAALARVLAGDDPEAALVHLGAIGSAELGTTAAIDAARRATALRSPGAAEIARVAVVSARSVDRSRGSLRLLAQAAEVLWEVEPVAAEPVLREVQAAAEKLDVQYTDGLSRRAAARALCRLDLPAAIALLDAIEERWQTISTRMEIAARIAATDPAEAEALLVECRELDPTRRGPAIYIGPMPPYQTEAQGVPQVVHAMAPNDPERALRIARGLDGWTARSRALMAIALALRAGEPERAAAAFAEALTEPVAAVAGPGEAPSPAPADAGLLADLARAARALGHPDAQRLGYLALACRRSGNPPQYGYLAALAFADPALAADLVRDCLTQPRPANAPMSPVGVRDLALAAAVSDAHLAAEVLHAMDTERDPPGGAASRTEVWGQVVRLLLAPPEDRYVPACTYRRVRAPGVRLEDDR